MYETIMRLFFAGKLSENGLENAIKKGWITREQAGEMTAALAEAAALVERMNSPAEQTVSEAEQTVSGAEQTDVMAEQTVSEAEQTDALAEMEETSDG